MSDAARDFPQPVHFVGIGGAGMSGIAAVLHELGVEVRGSDLKASRYTRHLIESGVPVDRGSRRRQPRRRHAGGDLLGDPRPTPRCARRAPPVCRCCGAPRCSRESWSCAAASPWPAPTARRPPPRCSHTSCARPAGPHVPRRRRAQRRRLQRRRRQGEWLVAEADESDGSLLYLRPEVAVVSNVELDHHANYGCLDEVHDVFRRFVALLPEDGLLVLARGAAERLWPCTPRPPWSWSASAPATSAPRSIASTTPAARSRCATQAEQALARVELRVPGEHNVLNALTALAVLRHAGVRRGRGAAPAHVQRRRPPLPGLGSAGGVSWSTTTRTIPRRSPPRSPPPCAAAHGRVIAVFQPHLYSRTRYLQREFGARSRSPTRRCHRDLPGPRGAGARRQRQAHRRRLPRRAARRPRLVPPAAAWTWSARLAPRVGPATWSSRSAPATSSTPASNSWRRSRGQGDEAPAPKSLG